MSVDFLETCRLYKRMCEDDDTCTIENFKKIVVSQGVGVDNLEKFFTSSALASKWDLKMIFHKPKILADCFYLEIERLVDLIIEYGVECELEGIKPPYFDKKGNPILGGGIMEMIESRRTSDDEFVGCRYPITTIATVRRLKQRTKSFGLPGRKARALKEYSDLLRCLEMSLAIYDDGETLVRVYDPEFNNPLYIMRVCLTSRFYITSSLISVATRLMGSANARVPGGIHLETVKFLFSDKIQPHENMIAHFAKLERYDLAEYVLEMWKQNDGHSQVWLILFLARFDFSQIEFAKIIYDRVIDRNPQTTNRNIEFVEFLLKNNLHPSLEMMHWALLKRDLELVWFLCKSQGVTSADIGIVYVPTGKLSIRDYVISIFDNNHKLDMKRATMFYIEKDKWVNEAIDCIFNMALRIYDLDMTIRLVEIEGFSVNHSNVLVAASTGNMDKIKYLYGRCTALPEIAVRFRFSQRQEEWAPEMVEFVVMEEVKRGNKETPMYLIAHHVSENNMNYIEHIFSVANLDLKNYNFTCIVVKAFQVGVTCVDRLLDIFEKYGKLDRTTLIVRHGGEIINHCIANNLLTVEMYEIMSEYGFRIEGKNIPGDVFLNSNRKLMQHLVMLGYKPPNNYMHFAKDMGYKENECASGSRICCL